MDVAVADRHTTVAANITIRYALHSLRKRVQNSYYNESIAVLFLSVGTLLTAVTGCSRMLQMKSTSS